MYWTNHNARVRGFFIAAIWVGAAIVAGVLFTAWSFLLALRGLCYAIDKGIKLCST